MHAPSPADGSPVRDPILHRPHRKLRISVTDRCAFRCTYCVPEFEPPRLARAAVLRFEEIVHFVREAAVPLGLASIRLTGGEPLQRRGLPGLIRSLAAIDGVDSLGLTTNAERLAPLASELLESGLTSINISLDTLDRQRFRTLVGLDRLAPVLAGIEAAALLPFPSRKLNVVPLRGLNDDELDGLLRFGSERGFEVRFIEFMPFGSRWSPDAAMGTDEILARLEGAFGPIAAAPHRSGDTARRYTASDGTIFGIIPTLSAPFCSHCNRVRLTADGRLMPCLFSTDGPSVRDLLRRGADGSELQALVHRSLAQKGIGFLETARQAVGGLAAGQERSMKAIGG